MGLIDLQTARSIFSVYIFLCPSFAAILHKYPEELRPNHPFEFVSIQSISARDASDCEMNELKKEIRRVLDWVHEESEAQLSKEVELNENVQRRLIEYGPKLR